MVSQCFTGQANLKKDRFPAQTLKKIGLSLLKIQTLKKIGRRPKP